MIRTIDDPLFALILRFAGFNQKLTSHDNEFFKKQLREIKAHVEQFSPEERGARAIEWIEQYAGHYRDVWNRESIARDVSDYRCPDCPLCGDNCQGKCQIHDQWVELLQKYIAGEINSKEYVEDTLSLLAEHKEDLKVKLSALSV